MTTLLVRVVQHTHRDVLREIGRLFFGAIALVDDPAIAFVVEHAGDLPGLAAHSSSVFLDSELRNGEALTSFNDGDAILWQTREPSHPSDERRILKRQLYAALSAATGISFPWGSLTGVRPTQMADHEVTLAAGDRALAASRLVSTWHVSPEKAALAVEVNAAEQTILAGFAPSSFAVYIGIPFCPSRCLYCSFSSRDASRQPHLIEHYVDTLSEEWQRAFAPGVAYYGTPLALYIGGGTPTTLADEPFDRLLQLALAELGTNLEITVEAGRPETITAAKLAIMQAHGISRICINPQTMRNATLPRVNRLHTVEDVERVFALARTYGMQDINMDLIAGLSGETPDDFLYSVRRLIELAPEKITLHGLARKAGAYLNDLADKSTVYKPLPEWVAAFARAQDELRTAGYEPYYLYRQKYTHAGLENIGFAKPGHETIYNVAMMSDRVHVLGFGAGASSKIIVGTKAMRQHNVKDVLLYSEQGVASGQAKIELATRFLI